MEAEMSIWAPKSPDSTEFFTLDLSRQLAQKDRLISCTCEIAVIQGTDPKAAEMLVGTVELNGNTISQKVSGGAWGCRYVLRFTVGTLFGEVLKPDGDFFVGVTEPGCRDLTTLDAVKAWLALKTNDDDILLQRLITAESKAIEKVLQRPVLAERRTDFIQSYGSATIMPPVTPIQEIAVVLLDGEEVPVRHDGLQVWRTDGLFWPRNSRIQVTYIAGYDEVPLDIEQACIELVAFHYRGRDRIGHASKSIAGETVSFITGHMPTAVAARLAPYRKVAPC
jgi:hypothetical protein